MLILMSRYNSVYSFWKSEKLLRIQDRKMTLIHVSMQYIHKCCTEILSEQSEFGYSYQQDFEFN